WRCCSNGRPGPGPAEPRSSSTTRLRRCRPLPASAPPAPCSAGPRTRRQAKDNPGARMGNKHLPVLLALPLLTACAGSRVAEEPHPRDPWEGYNRAMYSFNRTLDKAVLRPVARGYDWLTPEPLQGGIGNAFTNLHYPVVILNLALQGRPADSGVALGRFAINSTLGIAGVFDVATRLEIPEFNEDFGQTLAVWGWRDSRYLMLPLLGPSTLRDGPALGVDWVTDVAWNWARDEAGYGLVAVEVVDTRA